MGAAERPRRRFELANPGLKPHFACPPLNCLLPQNAANIANPLSPRTTQRRTQASCGRGARDPVPGRTQAADANASTRRWSRGRSPLGGSGGKRPVLEREQG